MGSSAPTDTMVLSIGGKNLRPRVFFFFFFTVFSLARDAPACSALFKAACSTADGLGVVSIAS